MFIVELRCVCKLLLLKSLFTEILSLPYATLASMTFFLHKNEKEIHYIAPKLYEISLLEGFQCTLEPLCLLALLLEVLNSLVIIALLINEGLVHSS